VKIRPSLDPTFFDQGFNEATDPFQLRDLADRLTHLFSSLDHGSVAILDGRWGTGKTVFAKQWIEQLKRNGLAAIYFDAFAADYLEHPFQAVSSAFIRAATEADKRDTPTYKQYIASTANAAKKIGVVVAKIGAKAATLGLLGAAEIEALSEIKEDVGDAAADASGAAVQRLLEEQADTEATFRSLRDSLSRLPALLSQDLDGQSEDRPPSLVVIIDELDRCRPDFALGILEVLKHFFRAERVHFVLVTNRDHLLFSVQKRYGAGESSEEYLQKFYDFIIHFEQRQESHRGSAGRVYAMRLVEEMVPTSISATERRDLQEYTGRIAFAFDMTLRQVEFVVTNIAMAYAAVRDREFRPAVVVCFLAALKAMKPDSYRRAKHGRLPYEEFRIFVARGDWSEDFDIQRILTVFQWYLDPALDERSEQFRSFSAGPGQFQFSSRLEMVPYLCNSVLDRFGKV
jgi:hypothetical protein